MSMYFRARIPALLFSLALLIPAAQAAEEYAGVVNHVLDRSTVRIGYKGGQVRVQLPGPAAATGVDREALQQVLAGKEIQVAEGRWENGRLIGRLCVSDSDAARTLEQWGYGPIPQQCGTQTLSSDSNSASALRDTGA